MRALAVLVLLALLAGCTSTSTTTHSEVFVNGAREGSIHVDAPREPSAPATEPARDPDAPNVTLDGAPSFASAILVRESLGARGERHPCGGAVLATAPGAPDPRPHMGALAYAGTLTIEDDEGVAWVTDRYMLGNASVWVQNVGGARGFFADEGRDHCPAARGFNVLLHADGPADLEVRFSPAGRPAEPERSIRDAGPSPS